METDISPMIDDMNLNPPHLIHDLDRDDNDQQQQQDFIYYQQPQPQPHPQPRLQTFQGKKDLFSDLDKTAYIVIFVAFILGFFMGKTMQPVILRHG
jgi:hypothetical protein